MIKLYFPYKSDKPKKKYVIITNELKPVYFGDSSYEHYTEGHLDEKRRYFYEMRHMKEDWNNPNKAAYWSYWYLWRFKTYKEAYKFIRNDLKKKLI